MATASLKPQTLKFRLTSGQLKVISNVLSNLAAGWVGSIVVLPGLFGVKSVTETIILLTYSLSFATLAMYLAFKIEESLS